VWWGKLGVEMHPDTLYKSKVHPLTVGSNQSFMQTKPKFQLFDAIK